jgi:large subunit ribosomal protein L28
MAKCDICGKGPQFGNKISHSHRVTNRMWHPNIQKTKAYIDNTVKRINVCAKCLKAGKVKISP